MSRQRGFSYLLLLFTVAILTAGLAGTGIVWHTAQQREREVELLFIGNQIRAAIGSYYAMTPGNLRRYPASMEELLKDPRFPMTVRHLRKPYRDPVTGTGDWGLVIAPGGGFMGVFSNSEAAPLKRAGFDAPNRAFEERTVQLADKMNYKEWQFVYLPMASAPARLGATQ
jgi:type II secretory pathway pseudopilin PulG